MFAPTLAAVLPADQSPVIGGDRAEFVPTPGHSFYGRPVRIEIAIKTDKKGRERATYYSRMARRWFPMPLVEAESLLAQGLADQSEA